MVRLLWFRILNASVKFFYMSHKYIFLFRCSHPGCERKNYPVNHIWLILGVPDIFRSMSSLSHIVGLGLVRRGRERRWRRWASIKKEKRPHLLESIAISDRLFACASCVWANARLPKQVNHTELRVWYIAALYQGVRYRFFGLIWLLCLEIRKSEHAKIENGGLNTACLYRWLFYVYVHVFGVEPFCFSTQGEYPSDRNSIWSILFIRIPTSRSLWGKQLEYTEH